MRTVIERLEITQFAELQMIQDESLSSLSIAHQALSGSLVKSCTYQSVIFSSCVFYACEFKQVVFNNCNFKQCQFEFSHFKNCKFIDCNFEDCTWPATTLKDSSFVDCELDTWVSGLIENHDNLLHFTFAETQKAQDIELMFASAFTAA